MLQIQHRAHNVARPPQVGDRCKHWAACEGESFGPQLLAVYTVNGFRHNVVPCTTICIFAIFMCNGHCLCVMQDCTPSRFSAFSVLLFMRLSPSPRKTYLLVAAGDAMARLSACRRLVRMGAQNGSNPNGLSPNVYGGSALTRLRLPQSVVAFIEHKMFGLG